MAKGMSPLRLFMRSNSKKSVPESSDGSTSGTDDSTGGSQGRQPLGPISESRRNPLASTAEQAVVADLAATSRGKAEQPTPSRGKAKSSSALFGNDKFPHLENSDGNVNSSTAVTPDKNAVTSSAAAASAPSNSKMKWHHRQNSTAGSTTREGQSDMGTPPRPSKQVATSDVNAGSFANFLTQHTISSSMRMAGNAGGGSAQSTPKTTIKLGGSRPNSEPDNGGSQSQNTTPSKSVSRSLKYTQPSSATSSVASGVSNGRSAAPYAVNRPLMGSQQPVKVAYQNFVVQNFELEEDSTFWQDHNVQVVIRTRPISNSELAAQGMSRCLRQETPHTVSWLGQPESRFTFDHVAGEAVSQEKLFGVAGLPMVDNCMSGYNSCMFAYGQTGSGKTHTMLGDIEELDRHPKDSRGMTPRVFEYLFARIRMEQEGRRQDHLKFFCKCSFLEIYNEQITDLLEPTSTNLQLREDAKKGVYVENLSEVEVNGVQDVIQLLLQGAANRKVAATNMNRESSRSHSVFTCVVESKWETNSMTNSRYGRLHLVDLAGSERQKSSGAEGGRLKEAANINKSLSTLGLVIMILVDVANGRQRHVPYRDSKLTFLLQDSLGGNSKTIMIANVSPSSCCALETLSTLKFAQRAKFIRNNAVINEDASGDVIALRQKIEDLKVEVDRLRRESMSRECLSRTSSMRFPVPPAPNFVGGSGSEEESKGNGDTAEDEDTSSCHTPPPESSMEKKAKSVDAVLAGALRREQSAEDNIKKLTAEIEQLTRLVRQREEDSQCGKMMLRFREEKIRRLEEIADNVLPPDVFYEKERKSLLDELQLIRGRLDRNPELTRFAMENIRLMEQLRRYEEFYDTSERGVMLEEISGLRNQLLDALDNKLGQELSTPQKRALVPEVAQLTRENELLLIEVDNYQKEMKECRNNLNSCMVANAELARQVDQLKACMDELKSEHSQDMDLEESAPAPETPPEIRHEVEDLALQLRQSVIDQERAAVAWSEKELELTKELKDAEDRIQELLASVEMRANSSEEENEGSLEEDGRENGDQERWEKLQEIEMRHSEEIVHLQLEIESMESVLNEERQQRSAAEHRNEDLSRELSKAVSRLEQEKVLVEALEGQQLFSIQELESLQAQHNKVLNAMKEQEEDDREVLNRNVGRESQQSNGDLKLVVDDPAVNILERKLLRARKEREEARRMNREFQDERASRMALEKEKEVTMSEVETQAALAITTLQSELLDLKEEMSATAEGEAAAKLQVLRLSKEVQELQQNAEDLEMNHRELLEARNSEIAAAGEGDAAAKTKIQQLTKEVQDLQLIVEDLEKHISSLSSNYDVLMDEKNAELRVLEDNWETATAKLVDYLAEGDQALTEAALQMEEILEGSKESTSWKEHEASEGEYNGVETMHERLQSAQLLARETEGKVRALSQATGESESNTLECHGLEPENESETKNMVAISMVEELLAKIKDLKEAKGKLARENQEACLAAAANDGVLAALKHEIAVVRRESDDLASAHQTLIGQHEELRLEYETSVKLAGDHATLIGSHDDLRQQFENYINEYELRQMNDEGTLRLSERKAMAAFTVVEKLLNSNQVIQEANVSLEKEIQARQLTLEEKEANVESLQHQFDKQLADVHENLVGQYENLRQEYENSVREFEVRQQVAEGMIRLSERKAMGAFTIVERLFNRNNDLEDEKVSLEKTIQEGQQMLDHQEIAVDALQQQLDEDRREHEETADRHVLLMEEHENLQQEFEEFRVTVQNTELMIGLSEKKAMAALVVMNQLSERILEYKAEIGNLETQMQDAQLTLREKDVVHAALQEQFEVHCSQNEEIASRNALLMEEHEKLQHEHGELCREAASRAENGDVMVSMAERKFMAALVVSEQLSGSIAALKAENVNLEQEIQDTRLTLREKDVLFAALQEQFDEHRAENKEFATRHALLTNEHENLQQAHDDLSRESALGVEDAEVILRLSERKSMAALLVTEHLSGRLTEVKSQNVNVEKDIQDAQMKLKEKDVLFAALQKQYDEHHGEKEELASRHVLLMDQHKNLQLAHEELCSESTLGSENADVMLRLSERKSLAALMVTERLSGKITDLKAENLNQEKDIHNAQMIVKEKDVLLAALKVQFDEHCREKEELVSRHLLLVEEHESLQESHNELSRESTLGAKNGEAMVRLSERKSMAALVVTEQLSERITELKAENVNLEKDIQTAQVTLREKDVLMAALQEQFDEHCGKNEEAASSHRLLMEEHENLQNVHSELSREYASGAENWELMLKLSERKSMAALVVSENLSGRMTELRLEIENLQKDIQDVEITVRHKDILLAALQERFDEQRSENEDVSGRHLLLIEEHKSLQEDFENLQEELDDLRREFAMKTENGEVTVRLSERKVMAALMITEHLSGRIAELRRENLNLGKEIQAGQLAMTEKDNVLAAIQEQMDHNGSRNVEITVAHQTLIARHEALTQEYENSVNEYKVRGKDDEEVIRLSEKRAIAAFTVVERLLDTKKVMHETNINLEKAVQEGQLTLKEKSSEIEVLQQQFENELAGVHESWTTKHESLSQQYENSTREFGFRHEESEGMIRLSEIKAMAAYTVVENLVNNKKEMEEAIVTLMNELQEAHMLLEDNTSNYKVASSGLEDAKQTLQVWEKKAIASLVIVGNLKDSVDELIGNESRLMNQIQEQQAIIVEKDREIADLQMQLEENTSHTKVICSGLQDAEEALQVWERKAMGSLLIVGQVKEKMNELSERECRLLNQIQEVESTVLQKDNELADLQKQLEDTAANSKVACNGLEEAEEALQVWERKAVASLVIVGQLKVRLDELSGNELFLLNQIEEQKSTCLEKDNGLAVLRQQLEENGSHHKEVCDRHLLTVKKYDSLLAEHDKLLAGFSDRETVAEGWEKKAMASLMVVRNLTERLDQLSGNETRLMQEIQGQSSVVMEKDEVLADLLHQLEENASHHREVCDGHVVQVERYMSLLEKQEKELGELSGLSNGVQILADRQLTEVEKGLQTVMNALHQHEMKMANTEQFISDVVVGLDAVLHEASQLEASVNHLDYGISKVQQLEEDNAVERVEADRRNLMLVNSLTLKEKQLEAAQKECEDCKAALEEELASSTNIAQERGSLALETQDLKRDSQEKEKVVVGLRAELERLDSTLKHSELRVAEMLKGVQAMTVAKEELELERDRLAIALQDAETKCSQKEQALTSIQGDLAGVQAKVSEAELREQSICQRLEELIELKTHWELEKATVQLEIQQMREAKDKLVHDVEHLNMEVEKTGETILETFRRSEQIFEAAEAKSKALDEELEHLENSGGNLQQHVAVLELAACRKTAIMEEKDSAYTEMERLLENANLQIVDMQAAHSQTLLAKNSLEVENQTLIEEKEALKSLFLAREADLRDEIDEAEAQLVAAEENLKTAAENEEFLISGKMELETEMIELNEDVRHSQERVSEQEEELYSLRSEVEALQQEGAEADKSIAALHELRELYTLSEELWRSERQVLVDRLEELEDMTKEEQIVNEQRNVESGLPDSPHAFEDNEVLRAKMSEKDATILSARKEMEIAVGNLKLLRTKIAEKDATILSARKEMEIAIANLKEAELEMDKVHREKERLKEIHLGDTSLIESLSSNLKDAKAEILQKATTIEGCDAELSKMKIVLADWEARMQDAESTWKKEKEVLAQEVTIANLDACEKGSEAAALRQKFENCQVTLREAEDLVDALVMANETAKQHAQNWRSEKENLGVEQGWWMPEREKLTSEIGRLESNMDTQKQDMVSICRETVLGLTETIEAFRVADHEFSILKCNQDQEMEGIMQELQSLKRDMHGGVKLAVELKMGLEEFSNHHYADTKRNVISSSEVSKLRGQLMNCEAKVDMLEQELEERVMEIEGLKTSSQQLDAEICEILGKEENALNDVHNLEVELEETRETMGSLEKRLLQSEGQNAQWESEFGAYKVKTMDLLTMQKSLVQELDEARLMHATALAENHHLQQNVKNFERIDQDKTSLLKHVGEILQKFKNLPVDVLPQKEQDADNLVCESPDAVSEMDLQLQIFDTQLEYVVHNNSAMSSQIKALLLQLSSLELDVTDKETQLKHLMDQQAALEQEIGGWRDEKDVGRQIICDRTAEVQKLQLRISVAESELGQNQLKIMDLVQTQTTMGKELEEANEAKAMVLKENERLQRCLKDAEQIENEKTSLLNRVGEILNKCERFPVDGLSHDNPDGETLSSHTPTSISNVVADMDSLLQIFDDRLECVLQGYHAMKSQIATLTPQLSSLELEVNEKNAQLKDLMDKQAAETQDLGAWQLEKIAAVQENSELTAEVHKLQSRISNLDHELDESRHAIDLLTEELILEEQKSGHSAELMYNQLSAAESDRDKFQTEVVVLTEQLEMAQSLADEQEVLATEARQIAEKSKSRAEQKEEEAKILGRSVEELESTVYALESQLSVVKRETESQRLARENLHKQLDEVKEKISETEMDRIVIELKTQQSQARKAVDSLQQECAEKDVQLRSCKAHIAELIAGAEKQALENQAKLKSLECMADNIKVIPPGTTLSKNGEKLAASKVNKRSSSPFKCRGTGTDVVDIPEEPEKTTTKVKASGSPFKCMGAGLAQQRNSEMDEDLTIARRRIKELEVIATARQKEVFMLNTKLAEAESMTHDVVRDLLGVKMDIASYATLLNQQQVQRIAERARKRTAESQQKDEELDLLREKLKEFIKERESWLEEINRRQAESVAARITAEKLRVREETLSADNENFQEESLQLQTKVTALEGEIKKLSGQQNLQQRIHHHAKIKEENNTLRVQTEDLSTKLRRMEILFNRVSDELAAYRTDDGKSAFINFDEESRLKVKLQATEEKRVQLAESLIGLCTRLMQAAGIRRTSSEIDLSTAMNALQQLQDHQEALERELSDYKLKVRVAGEKRRLSDLRESQLYAPGKTESNTCPA